MQVLVVKDGTIPIVVAEVLYTDGVFEPYEGIGDIDHDNIELFDVEGEPEALNVMWNEDDGFSVYGTTLAQWLLDGQEDETGGKIELVSPGHFVQADASNGEDERWYSHLFDLRGRP